MSLIGTQTRTYTVADIRKVVDNFAADFSMMAQATGLRSRENVADVIFDLKIFAECSFLERVHLILKDSAGKGIRAATYTVSESAVGWVSERPGNNLWPQTPGGSLIVVATLADSWWRKPESEKDNFIRNNGLHFSWSLTAEDTSFSGMNSTLGQRYTSNGYGWQRTNYN